MRSLNLLILLAIIFIAIPAAAAADVIILKDGPAKQGIIKEETSTAVKLRIEDAVLTIPRDSIQSIGYATPDENQQLNEKWAAEEERLKQERAKKRGEEAKFEAVQMRKGLVKVDGGTWVSITEAEKMREDEIRKHTEEEKAVDEPEQTAAETEGSGAAREEKAVNEPGEAAQKTEGPTAATSPKIIIDLPDEAKEIIELQFKKLEPMSRNAGAIEHMMRSFMKENGVKEGMSVLTITNKTDMCVGFESYIEAYNDAGEMTMGMQFDIGSLQPYESVPADIPLTNDMKEVRISFEELEWWRPGTRLSR